MKKYIIIIIVLLSVIASLLLLSLVDVNYDMKKYLPKDNAFSQGIELHDELYGESSFTHLILKDETLSSALTLKNQLLEVEHVANIDFIDQVFNEMTYGIFINQLDGENQSAVQANINALLGQGLSFTESFYQVVMGLPEVYQQTFLKEIDRYYNDGLFKMTIQMDVSSTSSHIEDIILNIEGILQREEMNSFLVGGVMSDLFVRDAIEEEVMKITLFLIPLVLVILLLMTPSFADLIVFMIISGVAIIINLGTNVIFPDISFITQSMAIALQLAISLDYIIFIVHRYHKDREDNTIQTAMKHTMKHVSSPVIASAVTTGVSFLALIVMRFTIGMDIGLVFFKAVTLSALSSLILGPICIQWLDKWMIKTKHRVFIPKFSKFSKFVYKLRYVFLAVFLLMIVPAYYFQSQNQFIYGEQALIGSAGTSYDDDMNEMIESFGYHNQIVILTEKNTVKEGLLYQRLLLNEDLHIKSIESITAYQQIITDPMVLAMLEANFYQGNNVRTILTLDLPEESNLSEETVNKIEDILDDIGFENQYLIGPTPAALSIKDVIQSDYLYVTLIALGLVMIVIFFTFKNWILPIILPLVIVTSVFLAMSVPYFAGYSLAFLGYLIVSTILLGATIDYAILFTKRYIELRETFDVHLSIEHAISDSAPSITTSALIFGVAGLSISFISSVLAIQQIGLQIALGALFGLLSVLVLLPQLILIFDKLITRSKIK